VNAAGTARGRRTTRLQWLALLLLLLLAVVLRIPSFWEPIGSDQAISALIADSLRQGKVFYRDVWDHHTPLEFTIHALAQVLLGSSTRTVYLLDLLWTLASGIAIYGLARRLYGHATALLGTGLYLLFGNSAAFNQDTIGTWTMRFKPEGLATLPFAVGVYGLLRAAERDEPRPVVWWGLAGIALGLATALKPPAAIFLIAAWLVALMVAFRAPGEERGMRVAASVRATLWLAGGALLAQLTYLVPVLAQATLREFWQAVVVYNFGPYAELGLSSSRFLIVSALIGKETLGLWLLALAALAHMVWRDRRLGNWLIVGWGVLAGAMLVLQDRYFSYQYMPLLPPLCLLAAYGVVQLWRAAGSRSVRLATWLARALVVGAVVGAMMLLWDHYFSVQALPWLPPAVLLAALAVVLLWRLAGRWSAGPATWFARAAVVALLAANLTQFATTNALTYGRFISFAGGHMDSDAFYAAFNTYPRHYSYPADRAVADWVRQRTGPDDQLGTLGGYGATPVYLSGRAPASRYVFTYHLFHKSIADHPMVEAMREHLLADLVAGRPAYIVLFRPLEEFERFTALYGWLTANYELEKEFIHGRSLYRRISS